MIYLAGPYSHPNPLVRADRSRAMGKAMLELSQQQILSFSPVFYGHELEKKFHERLPYKFWIDWGLQILSSCSGLYVVSLPGWRDSKGVRAECEAASRLGLPLTGYQVNQDCEEVGGLDIRKEFDLPIVRAKWMVKL